MESNIEVYFIVILIILTIAFGVREILRDHSLSFEKRFLWIFFIVLFNILAVVAYLILRLFKKGYKS